MSGGVGHSVRQMRDTTIKKVGKYKYEDIDNPQLQINSIQILMFGPSDKGPFYVKEPLRTSTKTPKTKGTKRKKKFKGFTKELSHIFCLILLITHFYNFVRCIVYKHYTKF